MQGLRSFLSLALCSAVPLLLMAMLVAAFSPPLSAEGETPPPLAVPAGAFSPPEPYIAVEDKPAAVEPEPEPELDLGDGARVAAVLDRETLRYMPLADYLAVVLAAEMPASFHLEALKAQACAARTDTVYRQGRGAVHQGGASCTDPGCCKAYLSPAELKQRWGEDYERNWARVCQAVTETDGEVVVYQGEAIFAAFHAASPGSTEDSENVWLQALPYLRSVESYETAELVPDYYSELTISYPELRRTAEAAYPGIELSGEPAHWLTEAVYGESGRLQSAHLGSVTLSGSQLRALLSLRSAAIRWTCDGEGIRFETAGYGHGVGLSQYGAEAMAQDGQTYRQILGHYYTGTDIQTLD